MTRKVGIQAYIPYEKVMELDRFVERDKAAGVDSSRNKLINEAVEMYIKHRQEQEQQQ